MKRWVTIIRTQKLFLSSFNANSFLIFSCARCCSSSSRAQVAPAATLGGDPVRVKNFNSNCAACHRARATGPALRGIAQKHDKEWLYKWIHNPAAMISQAMLQR
jgi:mono/diheme cytochrome c family protein